MDEILRAFESFATTPPTVDEWVPTHDRFDDQGFVEEMYKEAIKWPVYCWKAGWRGMEITDNTKFLQYIKAPTICMWGSEDDIFTEEYQKELLSNIPDVEAVYFDGASHEIQQEKHQEIANQIKNLYSIDY
jgi:pimeloyl-ACP methyl ester carboxylesterase